MEMQEVTVDFSKYSRQELEDMILIQRTHIRKLTEANSSMMKLIQANDQKTALMEASPEFAEAMSKIDVPQS